MTDRAFNRYQRETCISFVQIYSKDYVRKVFSFRRCGCAVYDRNTNKHLYLCMYGAERFIINSRSNIGRSRPALIDLNQGPGLKTCRP